MAGTLREEMREQTRDPVGPENGHNEVSGISSLGLDWQRLSQLSEFAQDEHTRLLFDMYYNLLHQADVQKSKRQSTFRKIIKRNIAQCRHEHVMAQLKVLEKSQMGELLNSASHDGLNILQYAAFLYREDKNELQAIKEIVRLCPDLIWQQRTGRFNGQTILHIAIVKENKPAIEFLLDREAEAPKEEMDLQKPLLRCAATGSGFKSTVMMGELPLSVAALTFNWEIVELLVDGRNGVKADVYGQNSRGDTVFHSLVRYAGLYPAKQQAVHDMLEKLHRKIEEKWKDEKAEARDIWLVENKEGLTALRLAALLAQPELFDLILNLDGVYKHLDLILKYDQRQPGSQEKQPSQDDDYDDLDDSNAVFDSVIYDVTEVDPLALREWELGPRDERPTTQEHDEKAHEEERRKLSVLEIIGKASKKHSARDSSGVLTADAVYTIIRLKWERYRPWFLGWAVLHFAVMIVLSVYTVYRCRLIGYQLQSVQAPAAEERFVMAVAAGFLIPPVLVVAMELFLRFGRLKKRWKWSDLLHYNRDYWLLFCFFIICLAADAIWFLSQEAKQQNYLISMALISGWWFTTFFLRPFKRFSFLTIVLHRIFFRDILRFIIIILVVFVAFSIAMHGTYVVSDTLPLEEPYKDIWRSMLTMFQLMLGIAESTDALPGDKENPFAVILYIGYVLFTHILILNAIIAFAANTCTSISNEEERYHKLQRLSVLLMMEHVTPFGPEKMMLPEIEERKMTKFDFEHFVTVYETRYFLKLFSPYTGKRTAKEQNRSHLALLSAFAKQKFRLDEELYKKPKKDTDNQKQNGNETDGNITTPLANILTADGGRGKSGTQTSFQLQDEFPPPIQDMSATYPIIKKLKKRADTAREDKKRSKRRPHRVMSMSEVSPDVYVITPATDTV